MNQPQQITDQQMEAYLFADYKEKVKKGIITHERSGDVVLMKHKMFDALQREIEPIIKPFSSQQVAKIRISRRQQRDQIELEILALREQAEKLEKEDAELFDLLERDIAKAMKAKE